MYVAISPSPRPTPHTFSNPFGLGCCICKEAKVKAIGGRSVGLRDDDWYSWVGLWIV